MVALACRPSIIELIRCYAAPPDVRMLCNGSRWATFHPRPSWDHPVGSSWTSDVVCRWSLFHPGVIILVERLEVAWVVLQEVSVIEVR